MNLGNLPIEDGLIVRPIIENVQTEDTDVIQFTVRLMDPENDVPVRKAVALQIRASDSVNALDSDNGIGVIGAANSDTVFSAATPAVGTVTTGTGTTTIVTSADGLANVYATYTGADYKSVGFSGTFGSTLIIGDRYKSLQFV